MDDKEQIELLTGACRAYDRLSIVMDQIMERGEEPTCHVFGGAFMMLLNDMIRLTREFACDEEKQMYVDGELDSGEENEE